MLTANRSLLFFFYAAAFTLFALAQDTPIQSFRLGDQIELSLNKSDFIYYKFRVDDVSPKYDLSMIARPRGDNDPELFLSTTEQHPNSKANSEYYSTSFGYSSIYIPSDEIKANTDYYLGVGCSTEVCEFMLTVDYAQEYYMREQVEDVIIDYVHGGTVVIRMYVPNRTTIDHILLSAEVETQAETDQGVKMYVNKGNEIPSSSKSDVIALDAWKDGKAANIFRGDSHFCVDCNYTIIVEAVRKSKVTFRRTFYGEQIPLELNHERNDAVELGAYVTYAVNISKFDVLHSFIMVEVTPYFGRAKVLANLETAPDKLEDYKFSFTGHGQELLSIPVQVKPSNNMLYVTVNGTTYSTYTIKVYTVGKKNMVIRLNEPEFGYILDTDVESFLLVSSGRKNMKMTFTLHPEQGKVNLFVKSCKEKDGCSFTKNEVKNILDGSTPTSIKTPIIQFSNATDGDETINIEMDGSTCESSGSAGTPTCYFSIGVLGIAQGVSKFTLTAARADLPQALRVSRPVKEHLSLDQYRYYYFTVGNDKNVESVNFQITKISGFVDIYISRKSKYPDARDKEEFHHYNDFYSFERANFPVLNGTYYIAIKAFTSATFSIVPIVKYNTDASNLGGHHLVKLVEGIPQKTVLDNGEPAYFKFDAFISETASQGLEITLDEVQGHFIICATTNSELPTLDNCQFKSTNNSLVITKDDAGFDPLGTYLVVVFPKPVKQEDGENTGVFNKKAKVQSFSITWAALHRYRIASFGLPLMNWVNSKRSLYYKIEVHPSEDKEIVIHKATTTATSSSQINLYLANVETKLGHNASVFNPDMVVNTTDTLKLKQSDIEDLCEDTTSDFKCYLYLAITTTSEDDISFTITITKDFDDLRISESVEATYSFPASGHPLHLYYYPHRLEDITILAHTFGRNITLYANVINTRDHSSRGTWNFPTNRTHEFIARNSMSHIGESRLHIPAAELSSCGADYDKFRCGIAMTLIYGEADKEQSAGINYKDFGLFSILANQEITPIAAGKPIHTSVGEGAYAYFSLSVNKDQATLMISANVLSGQHVVVMASKGKDARPTIESAEFKTYYGKMETLQVSGEDTLQGTARGDWVIAVYGNTQTEFVLNVIYENTKMVELHRGLPVNVDVNKDPVFFEYYHEVDSSFEFKIAKQRGAGKISIKYYLENETATDNLPTEHSGPIVRTFNHFQNVILISNRSEHFCKGCLYIVGIFPHTAMKVSLVTQIPGQFIFLQDNQIFADSASPSTQNKYEHIARIHDVIDINFVVYSGEPHIYISHNPTVNSTNYVWSYTQVSSNNYIRMRLNNTEYMNQAILDPVFDGARNVSSYKNIYYIMVTAPIDANYSIAVSVSNSSRSLIDGHLDFGFLNPGEYNLYKYHVSKDNIESGEQNRLKLQFTLHKDQFFTTLKEGELTPPNIVVMSVPHKSYNNASINKAGLLPDLPVLAPIRQDELERSYGDQHFTMNLLYQAPGDQDFYVVVNNSESNRHLNYSIVANSHEPVYLTLNNFHASRLTVGESEVYAVHASYPGLLVIEIHECQGQVVVQTSNSPNFVTKPVEEYTVDVKTNNPGEGEKIDDETFTGKSSDEASTGGPQFHELLASSMGSQIKTADITIDQEQTIYILVRGWDGVRDDDNIQDLQAVYKIRVGLHPLRNFMPFKNLQPGYDGLLTWDVPSSGKLKLEFGDVKNLAVADKAIKSTKFGNLAIQYHYEAIFTKRPEMGSYLAKCDMLPKPQGIYKGLDMYKKSVTFDQSSLVDVPDYENGKSVLLETDDIPEQYVTLKVTAVGVDANGTAVWDYPIIYKTTEVKTETKILGVGSSTFLVVLLVVCMVMLVAAIGGMYYYYHKFQRVRAKLNYEMQDLRNVANTVESFDTLDDDRDKSGYAGLIGKE